MTWLRRGSYPQAERKLSYDSVRLCFAPTFTKEELMRICKCGGVVGQHQLTNNREAWTCRSCGRYEIVEVKKPDKPEYDRSEDGKV
jgi:butyrate kinase